MERLLLNVVFVILPILLYQILWVDRNNHVPFRHHRSLVGLICCLSIVLCLSFPYHLFEGYRFDLRTIPLMIGILYGGYRVGAVCMIVLFFHRFALGGDGIWNVLVTYTLVISLLYYLVARFYQFGWKQKIWTCCTMAFATSILMLANTAYLIGLPWQDWPILLSYCILNPLIAWLAVYLIESMRINKEAFLLAQQKQHMRLTSELAASIAHEIRNPITAVKGFLQLLKEDTLEEANQKYIQLGLIEVEHAHTVINDYLSLAEPQAEKIEVINVGEQIRKVTAMMSSYAIMNKVEIRDLFLNHIYIKANNDRFLQLLTNMVKNGIEAMPNGGVLHIKTFIQSESVIIYVIDSGEGMTKEQIQRLGMPFYSTKETGTGLGMMICFRIVELFNGKIEVQSEKGKGTCFSLIFPIIY